MKNSKRKGNKSAFGIPPKITYVYNEKLENIFNRKYSVLIPDGVDGYIAKVFLRHGHSVDIYEENRILLDGGNIDSFYTTGLYNVINDENFGDNAKVFVSNFYKQRIENY